MTGGESFSERGLIPRAIHDVYKEIKVSQARGYCRSQAAWPDSPTDTGITVFCCALTWLSSLTGCMAQASLDHGIACSHFRGLLLSCLSLLLVVASSTYQRRPGKRYRVLVSYMEVYKESVYDLLDTNSRNKPLEEWTKVTNSLPAAQPGHALWRAGRQQAGQHGCYCCCFFSIISPAADVVAWWWSCLRSRCWTTRTARCTCGT